MVPFDLAAGVDDDLFNRFLAELVLAGALDLELSPSGSSVPGVPVLTAAVMAMAIPGAGFETVPGATPVGLYVRHTTAPVITFAPGSPAISELWLGSMILAFTLEPQGGVITPFLEVGVTARAPLAIAIDPVLGSLTVTPGTVTAESSLRTALSGRDPSLAGIPAIVQGILPALVGPFSSLPLPGAALGAPTGVEVSVAPTTPNMLISYFDLP
jgi:hypothetical protein